MQAKCTQCGAIVQAPETLTIVPSAYAQQPAPEEIRTRAPVFGIASLIAFCGAVFLGIVLTMSIASQTSDMASFGAIAGIGFGLIACVVSLVLAMVGTARQETPQWPAVLGFVLSVGPGAVGLWMLWKMLEEWYVG